MEGGDWGRFRQLPKKLRKETGTKTFKYTELPRGKHIARGEKTLLPNKRLRKKIRAQKNCPNLHPQKLNRRDVANSENKK